MHESLQKMFDLSGTVSIVTGASKGLGVSFARGLAKAGSDLVLAARNMKGLEQVAADLRQYGTRIITVKLDVTCVEDIEAMVAETMHQFGRIDFLLNNAGISAVAEAENITEEQWSSVIDTNVRGLFLCAQKVGQVMLKQKHGKIINIASQYAYTGSSYVPQVSYTASKAAVLGITRELAVEWGPKGIHVASIAPGFFMSDQTVWAFENDKQLGENLLKKVPLGRMGRLEELEGSIVYLASTASNYMHGQSLIMDGGFLSW